MPLMSRRTHDRREHGQALAEFALVLPILALLVFGIIDMARLYQSWVTVQGAAREGARYGVTGREDCAASTTDRVACIEEIAMTQVHGLPNHDTRVSVSAKSYEYPAYSFANADGDAGAQCDLLEVRVEYEYEPSTPIIGKLIGGVTLTGRERMVNEPFGPCDA